MATENAGWNLQAVQYRAKLDTETGQGHPQRGLGREAITMQDIILILCLPGDGTFLFLKTVEAAGDPKGVDLYLASITARGRGTV